MSCYGPIQEKVDDNMILVRARRAPGGVGGSAWDSLLVGYMRSHWPCVMVMVGQGQGGAQYGIHDVRTPGVSQHTVLRAFAPRLGKPPTHRSKGAGDRGASAQDSTASSVVDPHINARNLDGAFCVVMQVAAGRRSAAAFAPSSTPPSPLEACHDASIQRSAATSSQHLNPTRAPLKLAAARK